MSSRSGVRVRMAAVCPLVALAVLAIGGICEAQTLDSAEAVLDAIERSVDPIEDYAATIVVDTYSDEGEITLTQRIDLALLQPDKMTQVFREPEYLAGNRTVIVGDSMWMYISAIDTWYTKDLSELSTAEQPWLFFRQVLRDSDSEFSDYSFDLLSFENEAYFLRGAAITDDAAYGTVELWVPEETLLPVRRRLYDIDGALLVDVQIAEVQRIGGIAYVAVRVETFDDAGSLRSVIRYEDVRLNQGLDPAWFAPPDSEADA